MKKILALLFGALAIVACSSDDSSSSSSEDPIFSQPYTELTSLDELAEGKYAYVGNKIGDRKVGLVLESNECKKKDYLVAHRTGAVLDSLSYNNFGMKVNDNKRECGSIFEFPRIVRNMALEAPGDLKVLVTDDYLHKIVIDKGPDEDPEIKYERRRKPAHYDGNIEIGFQAGYLRVEDRLSDYQRLKDEKVYLYFKKM
ncbi:hypothetical protein ACPDHL_13625 [Myroides sp. C15-4]|uniref:hypothetical protein n=1 Tax=Myroides sp. C15-4 TaxID=3400532 RepID=UPI003D2F9357